MSYRLARIASFLPVLSVIASVAAGQTGVNVLVVANESAPGSLRIAERYVERRALPPEQLVRLRLPAAEEVSRADYERRIQAPIEAWLSAHQAQDRILYIVLTKGVPFRVGGTKEVTDYFQLFDYDIASMVAAIKDSGAK